MIKFTSKGDFSKTTNFLSSIKKRKYISGLSKYGEKGVAALSSSTPVDTGLTSESWGYDIVQNDSGVKIVFTNSNIQNGVPIAVVIQYGHGTGTGGWVEGIDYINPAIRPIFDEILNNAWEEVCR